MAFRRLAMQYAGNRLMSVTDGNSAPMLYDYDADGNLASDGHTGFEFFYNILNLPMSAEDSADGRTMTYTYLSDGTKLKAVSDGGAGLTYRGSFVYGLSSGSGCTLESVATDEGRIVMDGTAVKDEWHVRDHVGNVRSVVWLNAPAGTSVSASILEQNDYLPFGTRLPGSRTDQSNRYRLGGKEEQDIAGMDLSLLDFGARYYDAYVGRWNSVDPLAHKYFPMSPYNYCGNDPVNRFDPDGRELKPSGEEELEVIRNTLPEDARQFVQLNNEGYIDINLLLNYSGTSKNYSSLVKMVESEKTIIFSISENFQYMQVDGAIGSGQLSYFEPDEFLMDSNVEVVSGLSTGESGNYGKTLFPDKEGVQNSSSEKIEVYIHPSLSAIGKAEAFSHEGYGHTLLYIQNGYNHQGASHQPKGMCDSNATLVDMILTARKETLKNMNK